MTGITRRNALRLIAALGVSISWPLVLEAIGGRTLTERDHPPSKTGEGNRKKTSSNGESSNRSSRTSLHRDVELFGSHRRNPKEHNRAQVRVGANAGSLSRVDKSWREEMDVIFGSRALEAGVASGSFRSAAGKLRAYNSLADAKDITRALVNLMSPETRAEGVFDLEKTVMSYGLQHKLQQKLQLQLQQRLTFGGGGAAQAAIIARELTAMAVGVVADSGMEALSKTQLYRAHQHMFATERLLIKALLHYQVGQLESAYKQLTRTVKTNSRRSPHGIESR